MGAYQRELDTALQAVREAARVCRAVQAAITDEVLEKNDRSPVTVADFASQAIICRTLEFTFPNDPVIGEEDATELRKPESAEFLTRVQNELREVGLDASADDVFHWIDRGGTPEYRDRFWTLDPIDGTKGFLRGEQYAISLALIVGGRIEVAVLGCPNLPLLPTGNAAPGALFCAIRGQGSFVRNFADGAEPQRISATANADPGAARFCESVESGHSSHDQSAQAAAELGIGQPPVRLDSQAKYAVVGRGEADVYLRLPTRKGYREKIWDHAGGVLVVEEAGGRVSDVDGKPLEFTHGRELSANRGVIVTNGLLHDRVLAALRTVGV